MEKSVQAKRPNKGKVSDYEFLLSLASAYQAFSTSATDPVVLQTDFYRRKDTNLKAAFAHIYWDCHEDENLAASTMQERIRNAGQDILEHSFAHIAFQKYFEIIQNSLKNNNRQAIVEAIPELNKEIIRYTDIVKTHQEKREANSFLSFPSAVPGHIFYMKSAPVIASLQFNPALNYEGIKRETENLESSLGAFTRNSGDLSETELDLGRGAGNLRDGSLKGQILTNLLLLKRAGFNDIEKKIISPVKAIEI